MKLHLKEQRLQNLLIYITGKFKNILKLLTFSFYISIDFMKQVVENGNEFTKSHFFMMLLNLTPTELEEPIV